MNKNVKAVLGVILLIVLVRSCFGGPSGCDCVPLLQDRWAGSIEEQEACRDKFVSVGAAMRACD